MESVVETADITLEDAHITICDEDDCVDEESDSSSDDDSFFDGYNDEDSFSQIATPAAASPPVDCGIFARKQPRSSHPSDRLVAPWSRLASGKFILEHCANTQLLPRQLLPLS